MSISINNTYGNYYSNAVYNTKKNEQAEKGKTEKVQSSEEKVEEYYEQLCKKFPEISFNTKGGELQCGSNKVVVNLSHDCLKKMANDPEFAKEIEWNLSGEVAANSMLYSWAKRDGVELGGPTVTYDANGNRTSSCGGMRTANAWNNTTKIIQDKGPSMQERIKEKREEKEKMEARMKELREEKEKMEARMEEIREEREAYLKRAVNKRTNNNDPLLDTLNQYGLLKQRMTGILQPNTNFSDFRGSFNVTA